MDSNSFFMDCNQFFFFCYCSEVKWNICNWYFNVVIDGIVEIGFSIYVEISSFLMQRGFLNFSFSHSVWDSRFDGINGFW